MCLVTLFKRKSAPGSDFVLLWHPADEEEQSGRVKIPLSIMRALPWLARLTSAKRKKKVARAKRLIKDNPHPSRLIEATLVLENHKSEGHCFIRT
jgi:hypothetical protein